MTERMTVSMDDELAERINGQLSYGDNRSELVRDLLREALDDREAVSTATASDQEPTTQPEDVVGWVRENQPVSRQDIVQAFRDEWERRGIQGDSWWRRHAKEELEAAGGEFTRNVGWTIGQ